MGVYSAVKQAINDSNLQTFINNVVFEANVLSGVDVTSAGNSSNYDASGSKQLELLIYVTSVTGTPSVTFSIDVIEPQSGNVITSYNSSAITAAGGTSVVIPEGSVIGKTVRVSWSGTVDALNYLSGVYVTLIGKR